MFGMDRSDKIALWATGGFMFYWYILRGWKYAKVWLQSYELVSTNILKGTVDIKVTIGINNPLIVSIPIHRIAGTFTLDGTKVATIDKIYDDKIKARNTTLIPIPVVGQLSALSLTTDLINNDGLSGMVLGVDVQVEIGGSARSITLPIKTNVTLE